MRSDVAGAGSRSREISRVVGRFRHLARRFFGVLSARVEPSELSILDRYFSASERHLFLRMRIADQRHSLDLCGRLIRDGHSDPDLIRAALLHDVGKAFGPLPLPFRVAFALCRMADSRLAAWLAHPDRPGLFLPFQIAGNHAAIGARAAEQAGSNSTVVRLIAGHDSVGDDDLSRLLHQYDGQM